MQRTEAHAARKRFGQHFLVDSFAIDAIVALLDPGPQDRILEIGPGRGALTGQLAASGAALEIVEIDRDLAAALAQQFAGSPNVVVHTADILKFDLGTLDRPGAPWKLIGNLPYNISTPLLLRVLELPERFATVVVMVQKEVAERLAAGPGSRAYGRLSVVAQRHWSVVPHLELGPDSFSPPPAVDSTVLEFTPRGRVADPEFERWFRELLRLAFGARRKTLANALRHTVATSVIEACDIDPRARAEHLTVAEFERLAQATRPPAAAQTP